MNQSWVFIITEFSDYNHGGLDAILVRLRADNRWKIGTRTLYRERLKEGDTVLFYLSGKDNMCFVGTAVLRSEYYAESDPIYGHVDLQDLKWFKKPVSIRPLIKNLHFIRHKEHWGLSFQNGIAPIGQDDLRFVILRARYER